MIKKSEITWLDEFILNYLSLDVPDISDETYQKQEELKDIINKRIEELKKEKQAND